MEASTTIATNNTSQNNVTCVPQEGKKIVQQIKMVNREPKPQQPSHLTTINQISLDTIDQRGRQ
jgi:hypothetical protein